MPFWEWSDWSFHSCWSRVEQTPIPQLHLAGNLDAKQDSSSFLWFGNVHRGLKAKWDIGRTLVYQNIKWVSNLPKSRAIRNWNNLNIIRTEYEKLGNTNKYFAILIATTWMVDYLHLLSPNGWQPQLEARFLFHITTELIQRRFWTEWFSQEEKQTTFRPGIRHQLPKSSSPK